MGLGRVATVVDIVGRRVLVVGVIVADVVDDVGGRVAAGRVVAGAGAEQPKQASSSSAATAKVANTIRWRICPFRECSIAPDDTWWCAVDRMRKRRSWPRPRRRDVILQQPSRERRRSIAPSCRLRVPCQQESLTLCPHNRPTEEEQAKWQRVRPVMNEILQKKGLVKVAEDKIMVTGTKGPLEEGWQKKVEAFVGRLHELET
jgi:hypothetical protein